jgi:hypothetical protein
MQDVFVNVLPDRFLWRQPSYAGKSSVGKGYCHSRIEAADEARL